jgi:hypothetical protein
MTRQQQTAAKDWYTAVVTILLLFVAFPVPAQEPQPAGKPPVPISGPPSVPGGQMNEPRPLESTSLEDLLLEKGVITLDDWIRIKAEEERKQSERSVVAEFTGSARWLLRYNFTSNNNLRTYHDISVGSASTGAQPGFFFRRIRWVITGQVSEHVSFFIQPDMATQLSGNTTVLSMM